MMHLLWIAIAGLGLAGPALASDDSARPYKPFIILDSSSEKDSLANDYINANITIGVKTANKVEYSVKSGISLKDVPNSSYDSLFSNIEVKVKKSYAIGTFFTPYVAMRLGQKINKDTTSFTHYALDAGLIVPMTAKTALDVGIRHRDAFDASQQFKSFRVHSSLLYELSPADTLGLRFAKSFATYAGAPTAEEREGWRVHWQHNY